MKYSQKEEGKCKLQPWYGGWILWEEEDCIPRYVQKSKGNCIYNYGIIPDILLKASESQNLTDDYLRAEVDTFMFEGHDTTANAMSFATYLLARYPNVQSKAREELDQIFGNDLGMKTQ